MSRDRELEESILETLGAGKPLWRRRWVPEEDLVPSRREEARVAEAIDALARAPGILLHKRRGRGGYWWFLERAPSAEGAAGTPPQVVPSEARRPGSIRRARPFAQEPLKSPPRSAPEQVEEAKLPSDERPGHVMMLRKVLRDLGVDVREIDPTVQVGPTTHRYRITLGNGVRMAYLRNLGEDIGRNLGCTGDVLVSHIPGEQHVALDVPRADREIVPFANALVKLGEREGASSLRFAVGVTPAGQNVTLDLAQLPHLLVAGASGSGKTVFLQTVVLSIALRATPEDVEFVIIDPKGVDFPILARLPHLRGGRVLTQPEQAVEDLRTIVTHDLAERTRMLQEAGCSNMRQLRARRGLGKYTVIIIDEFNDLVAVLSRAERADFEREVLRLAQRARAAGIHLIIATQRPTTDLITGAIKANLPARISFRLPQKVDSMVVLDQVGAESLMGDGDMLLLDAGRLQRLQGYFLTTDEIGEMVAARMRALKGTDDE